MNLWWRDSRGLQARRIRRVLAFAVMAASVLARPALSAEADSEVSVPDDNLRAALEQALGKEAGAVITVAEMESLTALSAAQADIADLSGLEHATGMTELDLPGNRIADMTALTDLTSLIHLGLATNRIADVTPLSDLSSLSSLDLSNNQVADVTALSDLTSLTSLSLGDNRITDVTALSDLTSLSWLYLSDNRIADITALANMTSLSRLSLGDNRITDVTPLSDLTSLTYVILWNNRIADVTPLSDLSSLSWLYLSDNRIADVTALADLPSLSRLHLSDNRIADVTALTDLTSLTVLLLSDNEIADVTPLAGMTSLAFLDLRGNRIADVAALSDLTSLFALWLSDNEIADVTALSELTSLTRLHLGNNEIVDLSPLRGLDQLEWVALWNNQIEDLGPLVENAGLGAADTVHVWRNPLMASSRNQDIPALEEREVRVIHVGHDVPFLPAARDPDRQGFVRLVNKMPPSPADPFQFPVVAHAVDDAGDSRTAYVWPLQSAHFNADDLERGNVDKGIFGMGAGAGAWRLELYPELRVEVSAYMRTKDGFLTSMNALAPRTANGYRIAFFNPGSNTNQVSILRLANPGFRPANVTIRGVDDAGAASPGAVEVVLAAGEARMLTAQQLERGEGVEGALGDGKGKWRLDVTTDAPLHAMSLLESPTRHLTNLSGMPGNATVLTDGRTRHQVPLFPGADDADGRQGFARVVNHSDSAAAIRIEAIDDGGTRRGPTTLTVPAGATTHFNSGDLEVGNADKGLPSGIGGGTGDWRLELTTVADIDVLAYIRKTGDGFVTSMHDTVPGEKRQDGSYGYEVAIFNPASNTDQVSRLRVINNGSAAAQLTIRGVDDAGVASDEETTVRFGLAGREARTITSRQLESGNGLAGALGDGTGKWRLLVVSDRPIQLMNLLASPLGHLSNLSDARWQYQ